MADRGGGGGGGEKRGRKGGRQRRGAHTNEAEKKTTKLNPTRMDTRKSSRGQK